MTPSATATRSPTIYLRPTDTRWPTVTRTPSVSVSPAKRWVDPGDLMPTPTPTNITVIGHSVSGRPLEVYRFGSGPTARLIIAGIHGGNEWNTISLAYELIDYVVAHPTMIPKNVTLYIMPNLNPDGEARIHGLDGRVNDHGVDLNRNWPWNWKADWPRAGCWDYKPVTAGDYALSEPETYSLYRFIIDHPEIDALISYHAAKLGIFAGGVPNYGPSISLANTADAVSSYDYPPIDTHCTMTGDLTDWAATQHIAAIDIELDNFRYTDFEDNLAILKAFLKWRR